MRTTFHTAFALALSTLVAQPGYAQPEEEIPVEEGDLDEEGDEVPPTDEGEAAPPAGEGEGAPQAPAEEAPPAESPVEEVPEDEFTEAEGEDPTAPPPEGKGVVWGVLRDSNGAPVIEGPVEVVGSKTQVITDFDGRYRLELPPGKYSLRFFYEFHQPVRIDVSVELGRVTQVDAELDAEEGAEIETIPVETTLEEASIESQNMERQRSASVTDGIGRQEISKTPDSDAAAAAQRVVGANIVDGRFVYVRGLGERYSNALLFGAPLPSPEPDKAAVPLDLFPALVLDSVNIAKTFTPDMPGDFAGGSVQIETRGVPEEFVFNASVSGTYNTQTTFQDRLDYAGGQNDWLAFDDGTRAMPDLPDYYLKRGSEKGSVDENGRPERVEAEDLVGPGRALNTPMNLRRKAAPPDHGASVVIGNGWLLGGEQKLGVIASVNYKREYQLREEVLKEYEDSASDDRGFTERLDYEVERGWTDVDWGTFGSVSYQPARGHELRVIGLHSQSSRDSAALYEGFSFDTQNNVSAMQLDWVERGLTLGQLSGRHAFKALNAADLGWDLALARATRDQPDRRDVAYTYNDPNWLYRDGAESGRHFFSTQHEDTFNTKLDWTQPIVDSTKLKLGGLSAIKTRQFEARRFAFRTADRDNPVLECSDPFQLDCPNPVFVDENIDDIIELDEGTEAETDAYDAHLNVYAGYLMGDLAIAEPLRLIGGARVEYTDQVIDPYNAFGGAEAERAELKSTNWLPSAALVFSATQKAKVRMGYARTLARPQLRELAPFSFSDYFGGRTVNGNPNLTLTRIDNYDTRFEYYPTLKEVLAFSFFFKNFIDPIEPIMRASGGTNRLTYRNAAGAKLIGVELEGRKQLDFLTSALKDFSVITNLTLAHSRTDVGEFDYITSASRPLVNQAPWVFNFSLDYENEGGTRARVLYNVSGKRLVEVGADNLPDAYEHPQHSLDLIASQKFAEHWQVKAQATNILNAETLVTQGDDDEPGDSNTIQRYEEGVDIGLGLSYTH